MYFESGGAQVLTVRTGGGRGNERVPRRITTGKSNKFPIRNYITSYLESQSERHPPPPPHSRTTTRETSHPPTGSFSSTHNLGGKLTPATPKIPLNSYAPDGHTSAPERTIPYHHRNKRQDDYCDRRRGTRVSLHPLPRCSRANHARSVLESVVASVLNRFLSAYVRCPRDVQQRYS